MFWNKYKKPAKPSASAIQCQASILAVARPGDIVFLEMNRDYSNAAIEAFVKKAHDLVDKNNIKIVVAPKGAIDAYTLPNNPLNRETKDS